MPPRHDATELPFHQQNSHYDTGRKKNAGYDDHTRKGGMSSKMKSSRHHHRRTSPKRDTSATTKLRSFMETLPNLLFVLLLTLYVAVAIRAFLSLPTIPKDLFFHSISASDFHLHDQTTHTHEENSIEAERHKFPVSINAEGDEGMETIQHPGIALLKKKKNKPMKVPKFWDPPAYGGIRKYLGNNGERLMSKEEALSVGSIIPLIQDDENKQVRGSENGGSGGGGPMLETIFVAISSYRDYDCPNTVNSIFKWAKYPQRIRVGIVDQINAEGDHKCTDPPKPCTLDPEQVLCKYKNQIDDYIMDADLAVGPVFARHLGHRMYRGEYFAMQCDAHVRFVQHWDEDLISQWRQSNNEMAVLSTYLSDIQDHYDEANGKSLTKVRPIMCESEFEEEGKFKHIRHGQQTEGVPGIHNTPMIHPYWAAGFSFARGHFVIQVPYDQHLPMVFQGEEISIGLRGFTYGYDYYTPERATCFHIYAIGKNKEKRKKVTTYWEHVNMYPGVYKKGLIRLNQIIGLGAPGTTADEWQHEDIHKYGIGQARTLQKFFDTFGIHPESQTLEKHLCRFVGRPMQALFIPKLRENGMGIDYDKIDYKFKDPGEGGGWVTIPGVFP